MAKGKVTLTPQQISDKWNRNLKQAVPYIQQGIDAVTESPTVKAATKADKMVSRIQEAVSSGRYAAACNAVSVTDWKDKTKKKVAERLAGGVDSAMPKRQRFDQYLVNTVNAVLPQINEMPDMTLEDSINRVRAMMTHMANNPYKR